MPSPRASLLLLAGLLALGNLASTLHRSGIPRSMEGRVERIEVRREKHEGLDDVHLVTISGRTSHLDAGAAVLLHEGDEVSKAAWSTELKTPQGVHHLSVSRDFRRMAIAMPLIFSLTVLLLWRRRRASVLRGLQVDEDR